MRVALCIFGQPRWLDNSHTYLSHKYHIIDKYNADVFSHTWVSGSEIEFKYADQVKDEFKDIEDKDSIKKIMKLYNPKKFYFDPPINFLLDESLRKILIERKRLYNEKIIGSFNYSLNNENNHMSQLYSMSKAISLLEGDDKYDWVILSRFDNYIFNFPDLFSLDKNNLFINNKYDYNFPDVIIFGGQPQIETLNCFDIIPELCEKILYFSPEEFKRAAYQRVYGFKPPKIGKYCYEIGQEKRISIGVGVVRSNTLENLQI